MKKISGLDEVVKQLDGSKFLFLDSTKIPKELTIKLALSVELASMKTSAVESLAILELGLKLMHAGNELELEDSEFALVKKAVESNPNEYVAIIVGQLYKKLM